MINDIKRRFLTEIDSRKTDQIEVLLTGNLNYADYTKHCGLVAGLDIAETLFLEIFDECIKKERLNDEGFFE